MSILSVTNLQKKFGDLTVLKDISFQISDGEIVSIIGSSGSGKSTLLRCMNQLETVTSGTIEINGKTLVKTENGTPVYSGERCSKRDFNGNRICISEFQSVSSLQCIKERNGSACLCGRGGKRRGQEKGNGTA